MAEFIWTSHNNMQNGNWSGAFSDSSHWAQIAPPLPPGSEHPAGPPGSGDIAYMGAPVAYTVSGTGTAGLINVGGEATFTGSVTTQGLSGQTGFLVTGGTTTFGAGSSLTVNNKDMVVGFQSVAHFRAEAGANVHISVNSGLGALYVGGEAGAGGSTTLFTGAGTSLTANSGFVAGRDVDGTLSFRNGATATFSDTSFGNYVGFNSGSHGLLNIATGATVSATGFAVIGGNAGSHGQGFVTGAGSSWNQDISIVVGFSGEGKLDIEDEASVTTDGLGVGNESTAVGEIKIASGGTLSNGIARLGAASGSRGEVHVNGENSSWTSSGAVNVGEAGFGEVKIGTGGTAEMAGLVIGRDATSGTLLVPSVVEVLDGDSSLTINGDAYVGQAGKGKLATAGGAITISGELVAGNQSGGNGVVDAAGGGSISVSGASVIAGNQGAGTIAALAGGTITANAATIAAGNQAGGSGKIEADGVNSAIQSLSLIIGGAGEGLLEVKNGGGVTTLTGATMGVVAGSGATARIESGGSWLLNGNLVVADSGSALVDIASGGTVATLSDMRIGYAAGSIGTVELNPLAASLVESSLGWGGLLTVGYEGSGTLEIHNGALVAPTLMGTGGAEVAVLAGSHGTIGVDGADSRFEAVDLFLGGSLVNEGGTAELHVANDGYAGLTDRIYFHSGATISVATGGIIEIGTPVLTPTAGAITLHADGELSGNGLVEGPLVNDGTVAVSTFGVGGVTDRLLQVHGNVTGTGFFMFDGEGEIEFEGNVAASQTIRFDIPGIDDERIIITHPGASGFLATIDYFAAGDEIELTETEGHLAHFDDVTNVLEILDAADNVVATIKLTDANDGQSFVAYSNGALGTIVRIDGGGNADPVITSGPTFNVAEDTAVVGSVTAVDPDPDPDDLEFFVAGGADGALFDIDRMTGTLFFLAAPDFETRLDADLDNVYEVKVRVFDELGGYAEQDISVTVLDGNDAPDDLALAPAAVQENSAAGTVAGTLSATDPNPGATFTYALLDDNGGRFALVGNTIVTTQALDFEAASFYDILVEVEDEFGATRIEALRIDVGNVSPEVINGTAGADTLSGGSDIDHIFGFAGNDILSGFGGDDILTGGLGKDRMSGGAGADDFDFNLKGESGKKASTRDVITDFQRGIDDIDLSTIDAKSGGGNQKFKFIKSKDFTDAKGELRFEKINKAGTANDKTIIEGDINGDGRADFQIELSGLHNLTKGDFVL